MYWKILIEKSSRQFAYSNENYPWVCFFFIDKRNETEVIKNRNAVMAS